MTKKELRYIYKQKRLSLTVRQRNKLEDLVLIRFQKTGIEIPMLIMTYAAFENELDPQLITCYCYFKNPRITLFYPVVHSLSGVMKMVAMDDDSVFTRNQYGIHEPGDGHNIQPKELDMVLIPSLAFDENGNHVGYGKGHYDRFLAECRNDCIKIGFSFFEAAPLIEDVSADDI